MLAVVSELLLWFPPPKQIDHHNATPLIITHIVSESVQMGCFNVQTTMID
jgi:hypothetical protein